MRRGIPPTSSHVKACAEMGGVIELSNDPGVEIDDKMSFCDKKSKLRILSESFEEGLMNWWT